MSEEYYLLEDGEKKGPFAFNELIQRGIEIDTPVLIPGADEYQNASYLPEFMEYFDKQGYHFPTEDNLAGFGRRMLAFIIDILFLSYPMRIIHIPGYEFPAITSMNDINKISIKTIWVLNLVVAGVFITYNTLFEATALRGSIGKMICRIEVVDEDGKKLNIIKAFARNLGAMLSSMVYGLPFLTYFFNEKKQTWYDKLVKAYTINRGMVG